jgi:ABC-type nitrate/sulfonate/bicarbonate transport system substrate-binding protein
MTTVRVAGVPEPYNLPWHLAREQGHFAAAGVDLHWHTVPEGTGRMCQMLRDGELDMAVLVTEGAVRDILNGGPHRIVSGFVESPLPWGVHVPAGAALHTDPDLCGIPYAISRLGSGSHIMAMLHARRMGWQPGPEDLVVVHNMEGAAQRMATGEPLIFLWETYVTSRYVRSGVMRHVDEVRGDWPGFVIVAREGLQREVQAAVMTALNVLRAEVHRSVQDPHVVELVMQNADFGRDLASEWLKHVRWRVEPVTLPVIAGLISTLEELTLVPVGAADRSGQLF